MAITLLNNQPIEGDTPSDLSLRFYQPNVTIELEPSVDTIKFGKGSLYVHENLETGTGFKIDYPTLVLHAVGMNEETQTRLIYCQLSQGFEPLTNSIDENDLDHFTELKFHLTDSDSAEPIYESIQYCQLLHPDPDSDSDGMFDDADEPVTFPFEIITPGMNIDDSEQESTQDEPQNGYTNGQDL